MENLYFIGSCVYFGRDFDFEVYIVILLVCFLEKVVKFKRIIFKLRSTFESRVSLVSSDSCLGESVLNCNYRILFYIGIRIIILL